MIRTLLAGLMLVLSVPARADIVPPADDNQVLTIAPPGELDGSWRVVTDDAAETPLVTLDIAHGAEEPRAAGVFTALPGLCPPPLVDDSCQWDGISGEITDIVLIDGGVLISFMPGADAGDEQNLRLSPRKDGSWGGAIEGSPPRRVLMIRPPE